MDLSLKGTFPALNGILLSSKVTTLGRLLQSAGKDFKNVDLVAGHLGLHSKRTVAKLLKQWRAALTAQEFKMLEDYHEGLIVPNCDNPFPVLSLSPNLEDCKGVFLHCKDVTLIGLEPASGKEMYKICVKSLNKMFLNN